MVVLSDISSDLANIVKSAGQGVVRVEGRRRFPASGIVWSTEGLIVTAHHVLTKDEGIRVGLSNGKSSEATIIGRDPTTDLALLRISEKIEFAPEWVGPEDLQVGHLVLALGRPGKNTRAALGIISALGDKWRTPTGGNVDRYLQVDATAYPGFSGGPLVTMDGKVAGMNTSAILRGTPVVIPTPTVRQVVEELLARGRTSRGYLGVGIQPVRLPSDLMEKLAQETGLLVISVEPGSPAHQAGLVLGDTIVNLGNKPVRNWDDLLVLLGKDRIGTKTETRIVRAGQIQELSVTIGEQP